MFLYAMGISPALFTCQRKINILISTTHISVKCDTHRKKQNDVKIIVCACLVIYIIFIVYIGYEPADLTVHPPPRTAEGGFIFFV